MAHRIDARPGAPGWALISTPRRPALRESHPATTPWGELRVDPGRAGVLDGRALPTGIAFAHRDRPGLWSLPVRDALPSALAWHPRLPLVAGLALHEHRLHPWIADYRAMTVTVHRDVRAATSALGHGGSGRAPLAWCGSRLVLLTPANGGALPDAARNTHAGGPVGYEAIGPGYIDFAETGADLAALAAGRPSLWDPESGELVPIAPPLVARRLTVSPTAGHVLIEHLDEADSTPSSLQWSAVCPATRPDQAPFRHGAVPPDSRWALGAADVLAAPEDTAEGRGVRLHDGTGAESLITLPGAPGPWWPVVHGATFALFARRDGHLLRITDAGTEALDAPGGVRLDQGPITDGASGPPELLGTCRDADGRPGLTAVRLDRPGLRTAWPDAPCAPGARSAWPELGDDGAGLFARYTGSVVRYRLGSGLLERAASVALPPVPPHPPAAVPRVLTLGAAATGSRLRLHEGDEDDDGGALLLWLRAHRVGHAAEEEPGAAPAGVGWRSATLDLALDWGDDATLAGLHTGVTGAVRAALEALSAPGAEDRHRRIVVGGHSFGATLALYASAHVPGLSGAIAHSGGYNRTLTPGGFQYERRSYWSVPDIYRAFSALLFADRLRAPVLIAHGTQDANPATTPDQAVAFYQGVVAAGGHARLVLLPGEGHTFHHRETHESLRTEHRAWLRRCAGATERT